MEYRTLGKTGLRVSALGFGCGAVGGLMVRGAEADRQRAVERAVERGITYFDTAYMYGEGVSETNLGLALKSIETPLVVGTKVILAPEDFSDVGGAVARAAEDSLRRLGMDRVDLFQLHNSLGPQADPRRRLVGPDELNEAAAALERLKETGKIGHWGINGLGETAALHAGLGCGAQTIQVCFNLLNPSAGFAQPDTFPYQDYRGLIDAAAGKGMGAIAIRILAAGALSGSLERHPVAAASVGPIASGSDYAADVASAAAFGFLVEEGFAADPAEAAFRFALSKAGVGTALIGASSLEQFDHGIDAANKGPLPPEALEKLPAAWAALDA